MHIENNYKYELNGIIYVSGHLPEGAAILETMDILCAKNNYELQRISDKEVVGANIWLHDGDVKENYVEIEMQRE